ncbi:hypothetical protein SFRURICE_000123 [Spodoptera frugiperda]|nr:hypothetical protein SFRURICE_000123 [Spodoptera frugiperda]
MEKKSPYITLPESGIEPQTLARQTVVTILSTDFSHLGPRTQSLSNLDNLQQIDTEQISTDTNQWTEVPVRKRQRESPDNNKTQKQKKLDNYWLSQPTPTSNSFYELDSDPQTTQDKDTTEKPTKAPPLYVDKIAEC